jgi:ketosteroid isomerase-like protein
MTSANLELVRSLYAAWERGDWSSAEWADPDIELVFAHGPGAGRWTGLGGLAEGWRAFLDAWEDYRAEAEAFRELDGERVLVLQRYSGRGKVSGLKIEQMGSIGAALFHLRDGKVTRLVLYTDRERALADLGLTSEEPPPHP